MQNFGSPGCTHVHPCCASALSERCAIDVRISPTTSIAPSRNHSHARSHSCVLARIAVPPAAVTEAERRRYSQAYEELKRRYSNLDTLLDAAHSTVRQAILPLRRILTNASVVYPSCLHNGLTRWEHSPGELSALATGRCTVCSCTELVSTRCAKVCRPCQFAASVPSQRRTSPYSPTRQSTDHPWLACGPLAMRVGVFARDRDCCCEHPAQPSWAGP